MVVSKMNLIDKIQEFNLEEDKCSSQFREYWKGTIVKDFGITYEQFESIGHGLLYSKPIQYPIELVRK